MVNLPEKREREKRENSDFSGCLAIATVGQKAKVGQGLPNLNKSSFPSLFSMKHQSGQTRTSMYIIILFSWR